MIRSGGSYMSCSAKGKRSEFKNEFHGSRPLDARDPALHAAIECVTNSAAALHAHAEFHPSSAF